MQAKVGQEQVGARLLERQRLGVGLGQLDLAEAEPAGVAACLLEHAGREVEAEVAHALLRPKRPKGDPRAAGRVDDGAAVGDPPDRRHARVEGACVAAPNNPADQAGEPLAPDVSA